MDALDILAQAKLRSFPEAVADCSLVVGTTAVGERKQEHPLIRSPRAGQLIQHRNKARVALLFGSEKTGLSNDALSHCHWLMTIPMHQTDGLRHASMNLGQAAAVCLYELIRADNATLAERTTAVCEPRTIWTRD